MRIITISREFGSGGRELGKRMADYLGFDYYDREILEKISENYGVDEKYVEEVLNGQACRQVPLTFRNTFRQSIVSAQNTQATLLVKEKQLIEDVAKKGRNMIVVGRNASNYLSKYKPFNLFVCADLNSRMERCREREEGEQLSDKELLRKIREVDKAREKLRSLVDAKPWNDMRSYHMTVNTTGMSIKAIVKPVSEFALSFFEDN